MSDSRIPDPARGRGTAAGSQLTLDAEALYRELLRGVRMLMNGGGATTTRLVGIVSGGAWLARRLHADLALDGTPGTITSALHRDDFAQRGLSGRGAQTVLPFEIDGADLLLIDDVLYTGRTVRAVLNELYDFGRPARVRLAVLVDRGGRELPLQADFVAARVALPPTQLLALAQEEDGASGRLSFRIEDRS